MLFPCCKAFCISVSELQFAIKYWKFLCFVADPALAEEISSEQVFSPGIMGCDLERELFELLKLLQLLKLVKQHYIS